MTEQPDDELNEIFTPVNAVKFGKLLQDNKYPDDEIQFLVKGFTEGFSIGYAGPQKRRHFSNNIPFTPGVGDKHDLWGKIMTEVEAWRVAGPYKSIPYDNFMQSPVGLVGKAGGKTRMIFHLSYNFSKDEKDWSLNYHTPKEICTVKYNDLDAAVLSCLRVGSNDAAKVTSQTRLSPVWLAKSDLKMAFRMILI